MKNILIIYPHWPPSNLTGVHRPRLIGNFLHDFGWHPIVLTVHHDYYEEPQDWDMLKIVSSKIEVCHVKAFKIMKPRIIGDLGLRSFFHLKKGALKIIKERKIDFIWIPIPSFYVAVLGRILHDKTGVPYGIDYIDPWVHDIRNEKNLRAILSKIIAGILEPYAVKNASLISGVSTPYYQPVLDRNFKKRKIVHVGMPYGFDMNDHNIKINNASYPWEDFKNCKPVIYAGVFLPNSGYFTKLLFKSIKNLIEKGLWDKKIHLFFLGTGNYSYKSVTDYAKEAKIEEIIHEIRERFPFVQILNFLSKAFGVMIIGSTSRHYTASKTFQSLLSKKPVFSIFHNESSAVKIIKEINAGNYTVEYNKNEEQETFQQKIETAFLEFIKQTEKWQPELNKLEKYSAKASAAKLVDAIEKVLLTTKDNREALKN